MRANRAGGAAGGADAGGSQPVRVATGFVAEISNVPYSNAPFSAAGARAGSRVFFLKSGPDTPGKVASRINMTDHTTGPAPQSPSSAEEELPQESLPPVSRRALMGGGVLFALAALVPEPALALRIPRGLMMVPGMLRIPAPSHRAPSGSSSSGRSRSSSGSGSASKKSGSRKNRKDQDAPSDTAAREPDAGARDPKMPASRTPEPAPSGGASAASGPTGPTRPTVGPASGGGSPPSGPPQIAGGGVPAAAGAGAGAGAGGAAAAATGGRQVITDGDY